MTNLFSARRRFLFALLVGATLGLFSSCAQNRISTRSDSQDRLFPYGTYRHKIHLTLPPNDGQPEKSFNFTGIVQLKPEGVRISVLSFLGTTSFRISEETASGEIKTEVFLAPLKRFEPRIQEYYRVLRELLFAKAEKPQPPEFKLAVQGMETVFRINEFNASGMPLEFLIEHPRFKVTVKVVDYEI